MSNKKVAFIYLQKGLTTVPSLMSFLELLSRNGYVVDIFSIKDEKSLLRLQNVHLHSFPGYYGKNFALAGLTIATAILVILWRCISTREKYSYLIGVHLFGLFAGTVISLLFRVPHIYYNLEMYFTKELNSPLWNLCKKIEICCSRRSLWTITLDRWHVRLLSKEHGIRQDKFLILPNTAIGPARKERSRLLHEIYGLSEDKKIILTMGSRFFTSKYRDQILEASRSLPSDCVLFVHLGRVPDQIKRNSFGQHVIFGDRFIPYGSLNELYGSAYLGIVLYENEDRPAGGRNQTYMGLSSGQFNFYVRCGVPCITTPQPTFKWIFNRYRCGVATDEFRDLSKLIQDVESDYDNFVGASLSFYEETLRFEKYFDGLSEKIFMTNKPVVGK